MKLYKLLIVLIVSCFYAKSNAQYKQNTEKEIVIGVVDSLYSEVLKEQREIWIQAPKNFESDKKYPVIYVLDANKNFYSVTAILKRLAPLTMPQSIIVGITNTDRTRDFTPTNVSFQRGRKSETSGGAGNFIKFLDQELKPYINNKYPTENLNTIFGHSTGGLFVLYTFLNYENVFDNYLAIDPSLWWDKENLVKSAEEKISSKDLKTKPLYVAVANSIGAAMDTIKVRKDKSVPTQQIRANLNFHDILVKHKSKLDFKWDYFKDEDHGGVVIPAQYNGLRALFSWFPFPERWRFNMPKAYSAEQLINPFYVHYDKLSKRLKREVKPDWQFGNEIGDYMLTGHKLPEKALAYYNMNLHYYPDESRTYLALGDYYVSQKDNTVAIEYYKKAIEIDGNKTAKKRLAQLKD